MSCNDIPDLLRMEPTDTACKRVAEAHPHCVCEKESVRPALSPGIVTDDEAIARFVPRAYWDEEKGVTPAAFAHAGTIGMSVTRLKYCEPAQIARQQAANDSKRPENKDYVGYVVATCADVRAIRHESRQAFSVYDTALIENAAHSDVCQTVFHTRSQASEMRRKLQMVFGPLRTNGRD